MIRFFAGPAESPAGASVAMRTRTFPNHQHLDYAGLEGRLLASSYTPEEGTEACRAMLKDLRHLFDTHQKGGQVTLRYKTLVHYGRFQL